MKDDVLLQYERLRPHQIAARRRACPVAYLPIGTIEWHGLHGFDRQATEAIIEAVRGRVEEFLNNRGRYQGHGSPM